MSTTQVSAVSPQMELLTLTLAGQSFGVPVLRVRDVLRAQKITRIPLAPARVAGALNLRGRIVTAIDVRVRLGLPARTAGTSDMAIVVEHEDELYSLIVDDVGEVLQFEKSLVEPNPQTLDPVWRDVSQGIVRLDRNLLVIVDIHRLLGCADAEAA